MLNGTFAEYKATDNNELIQDLETYCRGHGIFPRPIDKEIKQVESEPLRDNWYGDPVEKDSSNSRGTETTNGDGNPTVQKASDKHPTWENEDHLATLNKASNIVFNANRAFARGASESHRNVLVRGRVLHLALTGFWQEEEVFYACISSSRILNQPFLPRNARSDASVLAGMIHLVMIIEPEEQSTLDEKIWSVMRDQKIETGFRSVNCTAEYYVRQKPISFSIGTKTGESKESGMEQLKIWMCSHFRKLKSMLRTKEDLPSMPCILIDGHRWSWLMFHLVAGKGKHESYYLWGPHDMGTTQNITGLYKILACLRRLAKWTKEDYLKWFDENILTPQPPAPSESDLQAQRDSHLPAESEDDGTDTN